MLPSNDIEWLNGLKRKRKRQKHMLPKRNLLEIKRCIQDESGVMEKDIQWTWKKDGVAVLMSDK